MLSQVKQYVAEMGITDHFYQQMVNTEPEQMVIYGLDTETVQKSLQLGARAEPAMRRIAFLGNAARIFAQARNLLKMARDPDPIDKHVGNRIRLRRLDIGCSQTKLAKAVGVTFQQVQKYEKGTNRIAASRLYKLAEILGVPITFFFDGLQRPKHRNSPHRATPSSFLNTIQSIRRLKSRIVLVVMA